MIAISTAILDDVVLFFRSSFTSSLSFRFLCIFIAVSLSYDRLYPRRNLFGFGSSSYSRGIYVRPSYASYLASNWSRRSISFWWALSIGSFGRWRIFRRIVYKRSIRASLFVPSDRYMSFLRRQSSKTSCFANQSFPRIISCFPNPVINIGSCNYRLPSICSIKYIAYVIDGTLLPSNP